MFWDLELTGSIINDFNHNLIRFYQDVRDNFTVIKSELDKISDIYSANDVDKNKELYYSIRSLFNKKSSQYCFATMYYFLNKTSFSGMTRFNSKGEFNIPFGWYSKFNTASLTLEHSKLLCKTKICNSDYSDIFKTVSTDDFMFLDPPYDCRFTDYGNKEMSNGFEHEQHEKLADDFKHCNCQALMIIGKTPFIEKLYKGYIIDEYDKQYSINIKNRFLNDAKHLVISNY